MDAIKFIEEKERMCQTCGSCVLCPAWLDDGCIVSMRSGFAPEQQINTVKVWAENNRPKTRKTEFLEQFPKTPCLDNGAIRLYPCQLGYRVVCDSSGYKYVADGDECEPKACLGCREIFWNQPVK